MAGLYILIEALVLLMSHKMCFPLKGSSQLHCEPCKTVPCPPGYACKQDTNGKHRCLSNEMKRLDEYILHHEVLTYNTDHLHMLHMRHKRSLDSSVKFDINAFNRKFRLRLRNDLSVFTPDFVMEINGTTKKPDLSLIYSGEVLGKPEGTVIGGILEGVFTGSISIPNEQETYHVEHSNKFFRVNPVFHSVIYKESDMNFDPFRERRIRERKDAAQSEVSALSRKGRVVASYNVQNESKWQEVQIDGNEINTQIQSEEKSPRTKRESSIDATDRHIRKNSCSMSLMADQILYNAYLIRFGNDEELVLNAILLFFATNVRAIKTIYMNTTFETVDGSISYTGMTFNIRYTKIMTPSDCKVTDNTDIRMCNPNIDAVNFLNLISLHNHSVVCLAYSFTSRDFTGGMLGLAWYGESKRSSGGVCERFREYQEDNNKVWKSLNTGFITTTNYGTEVPARVSQLIFAHEVGHSFGSLHDSRTDCDPYETSDMARNQGNYIMYHGATMGSYPHNWEFSKCSKDSIARVIHAIFNNLFGKHNCFEEVLGSVSK